VPRTVLASSLELPDPTQAEDHFWFTRPFTGTNATWGSPYYPFGTNNRGRYLWHHGIDIQNPMGIALCDETSAHGSPPLFYEPFGNQLPECLSKHCLGDIVLLCHLFLRRQFVTGLKAAF
jgi:hypothetical protein